MAECLDAEGASGVLPSTTTTKRASIATRQIAGCCHGNADDIARIREVRPIGRGVDRRRQASVGR